MNPLQATYTLNDGVKIPTVGFGTWQIPDGDVAYDAVSFALDAGYRHIDTAYVYGNEKALAAPFATSACRAVRCLSPQSCRPR